MASLASDYMLVSRVEAVRVVIIKYLQREILWPVKRSCSIMGWHIGVILTLILNVQDKALSMSTHSVAHYYHRQAVQCQTFGLRRWDIFERILSSEFVWYSNYNPSSA